MTTPVSYEIAVLLKENGFDKDAKQRYIIAENIDSDRFPFLQEECALHNWNDYDDSSTMYFTAPTIAEVLMWLYEKHSIWILAIPTEYGYFAYKIIDVQMNPEKPIERPPYKEVDAIDYSTPSECYEAAIKHYLK